MTNDLAFEGGTIYKRNYVRKKKSNTFFTEVRPKVQICVL